MSPCNKVDFCVSIIEISRAKNWPVNTFMPQSGLGCCPFKGVYTLFIDDPIGIVFCVRSLFCCAVFGVLSSLGITLLRTRELFAIF